MPRYGQLSGPVELISSAQDLTGAWVDLGDELKVEYAQKIGLYINLDINDSVNARIRLLAKYESGGTDEYTFPIRTVSSSNVTVAAEYIEFSSDADQKMILSWDLDGLVKYIQIQVQAGTVGATAGQVDSAYYTLVN